MLSARGKPRRQRLCAADRAGRAARWGRVRQDHRGDARSTTSSAGKFLSPTTASWRSAVIALDRKVVQDQGAKEVIGSIDERLQEGAGAGRPQDRT